MPGGDGTGPTGAGPGTGGGAGPCGYKIYTIPAFKSNKANNQNKNLFVNTNKPTFNVGIQKDEFIRTKK